MKNLTDYSTLKIAITNFAKANNLFSLGRARIFYIGPNQNRTIIDEKVAEDLIATIPGTPIVGVFDGEDFGGHEEGQIAYGFVPLEPNAKKVTIEEEIMGLPVTKTYYEVDVVIWDGRFPEAKLILGDGKQLSMELNRDTLQGNFEVYENKHYCRFTHAEFIGITVLGDDKTPCFKDAKFLQQYTAMLSAYTAMLEGQSENMIGGKEDMPNEVTQEISENVESVENDNTITNEGETVVETTEETIVEEVSETETPEEVEAEEVVETETETVEATEVVEETEEVETVEETTEDANSGEDVEALKATISEMTATNAELSNKIESLTTKLGVYEKAEKEALIVTFSKKIVDSEFIDSISKEIDKYSVEELKNKLGSKLAEQVLTETEESNDNVKMTYSYTALINSSKKNNDWTDLVRAKKNNK